MKKLYEKLSAEGERPFYFGIWSYNGRVFKITSTLKNSLSSWRIDVRSHTGKWTFETGNLIFENTQASYSIADVSINVMHAFSEGIRVSEEYITTVY